MVVRGPVIFLTFLALLLSPASGHAIGLTLKDAIEMALSRNHRIRSLDSMVRAQERFRSSRRADFFPKLSASYTYTHLKERPTAILHYMVPGKGEIPVETPLGERDKYQWEVKVSQPIFTGFAIYSRYRLASLGVDEKKLEKEVGELDLIRDVKVCYYRVLYARDMLRSAREEVKYLSSHERDAENLFREGVIPYNDLLKSKVALASAKQRERAKQADLEYELSRLASLLGLDVSTPIEPLTSVREVPPPPGSLEPLIEEALIKRPEIRELRLKLKLSDYRIKLAKSDFFPKAYFVSGYRHTGYNDWRGVKNRYGRSRETYLGIQIKWNLFEWGKTLETVRGERLKRKALFETLKDLESRVSLEVKRAFLNLKVSWENIETARKALSQARENYRITDMQYKNGLTTSTEVLDARSYLTEAEANYYGALYGYMVALSELERSVGRR